MMPIDERFDSALRSALCMFLGYVSAFFLAMVALVIVDLMMPAGDYDDDLPLAVVVVIGSLFVIGYGIGLGVGCLLGAMLCPAVAVGRLHRWGFFASGVLVAGGSLLLMFLTYLFYVEAKSFLLTLVAGFLLAFGMRVLSMTLGWARPWYPPGACDSCGYDLRETPAGATCPECGALVERPSVSRT